MKATCGFVICGKAHCFCSVGDVLWIVRLHASIYFAGAPVEAICWGGDNVGQARVPTDSATYPSVPQEIC